MQICHNFDETMTQSQCTNYDAKDQCTTTNTSKAKFKGFATQIIDITTLYYSSIGLVFKSHNSIPS